MWPTNILTRRVNINYPIIQAPMAGGPTTPELIAAVSNSGGLGALGAGYLTPEKIRQEVRAIRHLTSRPFIVNVFVPEPVTPDPDGVAKISEIMRPFRSELGLADPPAPERYGQPFDDQLSVLLEEAVPIVSFTFGLLPAPWIDRLKAAGVTVIGTATTVDEAVALEQSGVDVIVAQGSEAGGHRGTFIGPAENALIGLIALVPAIVDAVDTPVIAAGGIMDGRGLVAALSLGALGAQLGTAFLTSAECGAHPAHKEALLKSTADRTALTRAFSGKLARGLQNRFMTEMQPFEELTPAYPFQNALTRDLRQAAARQNRPEFMSLWAGQGAGMSAAKPAAEIMADLIAQVDETLRRLGRVESRA